MYGDVEGCMGMYRDVWCCIGVYGDVEGCMGISRDVWCCIGAVSYTHLTLPTKRIV